MRARWEARRTRSKCSAKTLQKSPNCRYVVDMHSDANVGYALMATSKDKQGLTVLVQVKISRRAALLLRKRAKQSLRSQASYLRAVLYQDLGLIDGER